MFRASSHSSHSDPKAASSPGLRSKDQVLEDAQEIIYDCLLTTVQQDDPDAALTLFQRIFLDCTGTFCDAYFLAIQEIGFGNRSEVFHDALKRSCYILLNNWETRRHYAHISQLVQRLRSQSHIALTLAPWKMRLHQWRMRFIQGPDYQEMVLLSRRFEPEQPSSRPAKVTDKPWQERYAHYFLVHQYEDGTNPQEQRDTARRVASQMRYRFKLDLAMYVAHSQRPKTVTTADPKLNRQIADRLNPTASTPHTNPTGLGDETLRLIKLIVMRSGYFSHENIAHIFKEQTAGLDYFSYKRSLVKYVVYSLKKQPFAQRFQEIITDKLDNTYTQHDDTIVTKSLGQRTCNQVARFLTTEDAQGPSELFTLLLTQGGALTLVIILLKLALLSPTVRNYLDLRVAYLVRYYAQFPAEECEWFSYFLDVFSVTFAIHAEGVRYSLVDTTRTSATSQPKPSTISSGSPAGSLSPRPPASSPVSSTRSTAQPTAGVSTRSTPSSTPPSQVPTTFDQLVSNDATTLIEPESGSSQTGDALLDRYRIFAQATRTVPSSEDPNEAEESLDPDDDMGRF